MSDENSSISKPGDSLVLELSSEYPPFDFTFLFPSSAACNKLKAHRDTLSSKCEFFRAMFASGMADALVDHMSIDDFSARTMSHFLHYLYHGNVHESFCGECFVELFKAGSYFGCPDLCTLMLDSMADVATLCAAAESIFLVAWPEKSIPEHFLSFVVQNLGSLTSVELTGLSEGALCVLASVASHGMCWAVTIFRLLETWAHTNRMKTLPLDMVELVPFERMWATKFEKHVEPCPLIPSKVLSSLRAKVPLARDWSLLNGAPTLTLNHSFEWCYGIAVAPQLYFTVPSFVVCVTDFRADTVHMFDGTTGQPISTGLSASSFGSEGDDAWFDYPTGIAVSAISGAPSSDVFVCDNWKHEVQVFSAMGVHKRSFGCRGSGPGELYGPEGMSIDHVRHEVHVCDRCHNRISVFVESDGRYLFSYGSEGCDPTGQLSPTGVVVDGERGLVAVVDRDNPKVSVFKTSGEFVRCFGHGVTDSSDPKCQFGEYESKFIALDPQSGHIVVSDNDTKRVQVVTWEGEWVGGFGPGLPVRGPELIDVRGVAVGPQGQLLLCCEDSDGKNKVMCF